MRIAFTTLGCKINQYETDLMRQAAAGEGNTIVPFDGEADVYVINTCSVTAKSDYQCRQTIRSAVKRGGDAKVIVTGCYAETRPEEIRNIPGVGMVLRNAEKKNMLRFLANLNGHAPAQTFAPEGHRNGEQARTRTRGFLKIQDGCDNRCSYCIVPVARGASRSVPADQVIDEFDRLVASGCPEVVLSGIHIGTYGNDLAFGETLAGLLQKLISRRGGTRLRLSSIEPNEITPEIIAMLGEGLCRHLHIPLQSGDDSILASMNRKYSSGYYLELLRRIAEKVPGVALGSDVMVGFPGEGDREFENTLTLIKNSPLTHLHVFSYSRRPGTAAAEMKNQVPDAVKKERNEALRLLGIKKNFAFRKTLLGSALSVVVEEKKNALTEYLTGTSDNYVKLEILDITQAYVGTEVPVRIIDVKEASTLAQPCGTH